MCGAAESSGSGAIAMASTATSICDSGGHDDTHRCASQYIVSAPSGKLFRPSCVPILRIKSLQSVCALHNRPTTTPDDRRTVRPIRSNPYVIVAAALWGSPIGPTTACRHLATTGVRRFALCHPRANARSMWCGPWFATWTIGPKEISNRRTHGKESRCAATPDSPSFSLSS